MATPLRNGNVPSSVKLAGVKLTTDNLRDLITLTGEPHYLFAARMRIDPSRLSAILNGRRRVTEDTAMRILVAATAAAAEVDQHPPESLQRLARAAIKQLLSNTDHPNYELVRQEFERHTRGTQQ